MILPPWAYGIAALGLVAGSFTAGWKVQGWRCEAGTKAAIERAIKEHERQQAQIHNEANQYEQDREAGRVEAGQREATIREHYRTVEVPGACAAPEPVRSVLDDAVQSANARARGEPGAGLPAAPDPAKPAD